jgi:hypothetical protein
VVTKREYATQGWQMARIKQEFIDQKLIDHSSEIVKAGSTVRWTNKLHPKMTGVITVE